MNKRLYRWAIVAAYLLGAAASLNARIVAAQSTVSPLPFKSTLDKYKPYTDEKIVPWKAANDEVGKIGGWRSYLKEANEPDPPSSNKPGAEPASAPTPYAGHGEKR
jgi:hypothetical protein